MFYDRKSRPISLNKWVELTENPAYKNLLINRVAEYTVSTNWLGINHGKDDAPEIFETVIVKNDEQLVKQIRYKKESEAFEGHDLALKRLRSARAVELRKQKRTRANNDDK